MEAKEMFYELPEGLNLRIYFMFHLLVLTLKCTTLHFSSTGEEIFLSFLHSVVHFSL